MDSFNLLLKEVMQKPSRAGLQMICSQVEAWESYMPLKVREKAQRAVAQILADGTLAAEEDMLRLYRIMAKHSRRMGASKVFEKVEEQGRFICSLKFHILWAETYAQSGNLDRFTHVLNLARSRLPELSPIELEAGFRDLADQYFPNSDIFNDDEETMAVFKIQKVGDPKTKRNRRRSSLAAFEAHAKDNLKAAHGPANPTFGQNNFFAPLNHELEEQAKKEGDEEEIYARSAFMRRRSVAPTKAVAPAAKSVIPQARTVQAAERSMELAEAVTSVVNPWDRNLRMEILRRSRTPCYQHNFDSPCPRVSAGKTMSFGGESFHIATLIGQGGFAKVYKAVDEEGRTLALKYEVPSCPWEVYICSEVKLRLGASKQFTLKSVMEVTDAYVFTNASVLFNEYHSYGTLLDLSNKLNDPSWYIILLIAIQMAKDGRPWTYQTDYFGFVGTLHVIIFNKYAEVVKEDGVFKLQSTMKRRLVIRPLLESIFNDFLNIPSCDRLPGWDNAINAMEEQFRSGFTVPEWRQAAARFNACL
ncbi:hypothetical protein OSTOST_12225 [Ostertagia ostertagi]